MLGVVGSSLKILKFEPTTPNVSQQDGQTRATACCAQQCCDMLRWHVAIAWPGIDDTNVAVFTTYLLHLSSNIKNTLHSSPEALILSTDALRKT